MLSLSKQNTNTYVLVALSFILCALLFYIEYHIRPEYLWQTIFKWGLFFFVPFVFFRKYIQVGRFSLKSTQYGLSVGLIVGLILYLGYYFLQNRIAWDIIEAYLHNKNITATTFVVAFLYVTFGNSFLEEIFFRGWVFQSLYPANKIFAYIFSSALFSVYHLVIFLTWFTGPILLIALGGLFIGGLLFAYLYTLKSSIWTAWFVHIVADLVIVSIAFSRFFS